MIGVKESEVQFDSISDGDRLKLIILGFDFPKFYLDTIKEADFVKQEQAKAMGLPFNPTMPSHKEGGMVMRCAVIERNGKPTIKIEDGKVILPKFFISCMINQLTLPQIHEKNLKMAEAGKYFGYFDQQKGLSSMFGKNKSPKIIKIHPQSGVMQDFDSKIWANAVPLGFEDAYKDLIESEAQRKEDWKFALDVWKGLDEHTAITELFEGLARRFALCYRTDKEYKFVEPCIGLIFDGQAASQGTKYWRLISHRWQAKDKSWEIFNNIKSTPPVVSEQNLNLANMISKALEEDIKARAAAKAAKEAEEYDADKEALDQAVASGVDDEDELPWN